MVDDTQTIELVNARRCVRVFDFRKPSVRDRVFFVSFNLRDNRAFFGDFPCRDSQPHSNVLQFFTRAQRSHLANREMYYRDLVWPRSLGWRSRKSGRTEVLPERNVSWSR